MMRNGYGSRLRGGTERLKVMTPNPNSRRWVRFPTRCSADFSDYSVLGLTPFASKSDVKYAYKRLALKYHPDVIRGESASEKHHIFKDIKSAYESLMQKLEEEELQDATDYDEWEEWMGFEGGIPVVYNPF